MKRKSKTLLILTISLVLITAAAGVYSWAVQAKKLKELDGQLSALRADYAHVASLDYQMKELETRAGAVDSLLFAGSFSLPQKLRQSTFYRFIESYAGDRDLNTFTNTEYAGKGNENQFLYHTYKVNGVGTFDDVYGLVYAIEHSKELKKIRSVDISSMSDIESRGSRGLVKFAFEVRVYFSESDQYASLTQKENDLDVGGIHNAFSPILRTETKRVTSNVPSNLPDIQRGTLISLVPQGAYVIDSKGNTLLLKKGDLVNQGYLDNIDYDSGTVSFILKKGSNVEEVTLQLGRKNNR